MFFAFFFFNDTATTEIYTLSLHDALPISPITRFAFPPVSAMPPLIFARLSGRVYEVRYRGTAQPDRAFQDFPQRAAQAFRLTMRELRAMPRRVNLCPPQAFIRIDVSYSAQNVLIEQQSLDPRAPRADPLR